MVNGFLKVFLIDVYGLLKTDAAFCFVTPYMALNFDIVPDDLVEPFWGSTFVGELVVAKRIYRGCPVSLSNRVNLVDFVEMDMFNFDVIFGIDRLHAFYAFIIDGKTRVVRLQF